MYRIERMRPPDPAYDQSWDLDTLVHWIEGLKPNSQLDLLTLRMKGIVLFKMVDMACSVTYWWCLIDQLGLIKKGFHGEKTPYKLYKE